MTILQSGVRFTWHIIESGLLSSFGVRGNVGSAWVGVGVDIGDFYRIDIKLCASRANDGHTHKGGVGGLGLQSGVFTRGHLAIWVRIKD